MIYTHHYYRSDVLYYDENSHVLIVKLFRTHGVAIRCEKHVTKNNPNKHKVKAKNCSVRNEILSLIDDRAYMENNMQ